jgi:hypothetical protein
MADEEEQSASTVESLWDSFVHLMAAIAGLVGVVMFASLAALFALLANTLFFATALFLVALLFFTILVVRTARYIRTQRVPPPKWLLRGYKLVEVEHLYEIHDEAKVHHSQTSRYRLKALQHGVELFEVRYVWTGKGLEEEPKILSAGHNIVGAVAASRAADWRYYYVHFGRELMAKKETEIRVRQEFRDEQQQFQPRLSKNIVEPIDRLILRVRMPASLHPANIVGKELSSSLPNGFTVHEEKLVFDYSSQEIYWEPKKVVLNRRYVITWDYA